MFKKITFFIFFLFLLYIGAFSIIKTKATSGQVIYIELGCSGYNYEIEDCIIISGEIDFDTIGEYKVTYFNKLTKIYFDILYVVTNKNYINHFQELINISDISSSFNPNYIISNEEVVVVASYKLDASKLNSLNDKKTMIKIYNSDSVKAMMTFSYYSEVVKMVFSKAGFIVLMRYDDNGKNHLKMVEYNLNGDYLREYDFASNAYDKPKDIIIDDNYIYLVFNSSSNTSPFISKIDGVSCAFIAKIDYYSLKEVDYISFGNSTSNEILDSFLNGDYLYILFKPFGSGDFLKKLSGSKFIVKLDQNLNIINYIETDNDDGYFGISVVNDLIYLLTATSPRANKITIKSYDLDLKKVKTSDIFINKEGYNVSKIISDNGQNLFVNGKSEQDLTPCFLGVINVNLDNLIYYPQFKENYKIHSLSIIDSDIYLYGTSDNEVIIYNYYHLEDIDNQIFLNNKIADFKIISDTFKENGLYGNNQKIIKFRFGNSFYIKKIDYYLPLESTLKSGATYEVGTKIYANGLMYLDNLVVNNGYALDKEGSYLLKIYGVAPSVTYVEFEVKRIINEANENLLVVSEDIKIVALDYEEYKTCEVSVSDISLESEEDNDGFKDVGIVILILLFSIIIPFIIPLNKFRGRK